MEVVLEEMVHQDQAELLELTVVGLVEDQMVHQDLPVFLV